MNDLNRFYSGKSILVTGNTGFKGGWLCRWLMQAGARVTGFSLKAPTAPSFFELLSLGEHMQWIEGDIRDTAALDEAFRRSKPAIVFHLAAQPIVSVSYRDPLGTLETNVMGTANLLNACRAYAEKNDTLRSVVVVTTDKCYRNEEWVYGYRENDPLGGYDPYSCSKACCELIANSFRDSFFRRSGIHVATARAGNVIGGGDFAEDRLLPDIVRALMAGSAIRLRNPASVRPWQHVLDPLHGYLLLARALYEGMPGADGPFNFGPDYGANLPVGELTKLFLATAGAKAEVEYGRPEEAVHETARLWLDSTKAKEALRWKPALPIRDAVELTARWYAAFLQGEDLGRITDNQIGYFNQLNTQNGDGI